MTAKFKQKLALANSLPIVVHHSEFRYTIRVLRRRDIALAQVEPLFIKAIGSLGLKVHRLTNCISLRRTKRFPILCRGRNFPFIFSSKDGSK